MKKVAIVTGGTRGIGLAISHALQADGFSVAVLFYGQQEMADRRAADGAGIVLRADVSDHEACRNAVAQIERMLGPVSVLVNNAGITRDAMLHKMPADDWRAVIDTNLSSCFNMCQAVIGGMRERRYGRIINISSINGQKGQAGQTAYAASKAGMIGFTKALALESAAKGITVNAICPGYIETEMTATMRPDVLDAIRAGVPVGRLGRTEEIAAVASFLASEKAAFITGSTISANGGQYMA